MTSLWEKKEGGGRLVPFSHLPTTYSGSSDKRRILRDIPKHNSGRPQQGPLPSNGMVTPSGSLRQDNSLEGSSRSGPNGNDSLQEGGIFCIPPSSPGSGSHRRVNSGLEQMESSVCLPPENIHDATSLQAPLVPKPRGPRSSLATSSSMVPRTLQKGRRPFAPSRPARTIRTLRKSLNPFGTDGYSSTATLYLIV